MAKKRKSFLLRVDPKIHDALRRWSDDEFRSLNAQVEMLLRRALVQAGRLKAGGKGSPSAGEDDPDEEE